MNPERFTSILARQGVQLDPLTLDRALHGKIARLLTIGNPKTIKGEKQGYRTAILHLSPAMGSGFQMCPSATVGCAAACLNTAGRGSFDPIIPAARKMRSWWFILRRDEFMSQLAREIESHVRRCKRDGYKPAIRLNGTSDVRYESNPVNGAPNLMSLFPRVTFYDYTKLTNRRDLPANYSLTLSAHEGTSDAMIADSLEADQNVAVVFRSLAIMNESTGVKSAGIRMRAMRFPRTYLGARVVDGDKSDLRFLDPRGAIVGLRAKGQAVTDRTGFVRDI